MSLEFTGNQGKEVHNSKGTAEFIADNSLFFKLTSDGPIYEYIKNKYPTPDVYYEYKQVDGKWTKSTYSQSNFDDSISMLLDATTSFLREDLYEYAYNINELKFDRSKNMYYGQGKAVNEDQQSGVDTDLYIEFHLTQENLFKKFVANTTSTNGIYSSVSKLNIELPANQDVSFSIPVVDAE